MKIKNNQQTKNFIWNTIGLTFNAFNSLFFLIIAKLVNGLDIAGIFTYAFSLCSIFYVLSIYYNRAFQVSDLHNKYSFSDLFSTRIIFSAVSLMLIFLFSVVSGFDFYKITVIMLIMIFRITESIGDCFHGALQKQNRLDQAGISLTIKAISGVLFFLIVDLITNNLIFSLIALIIINLFWFTTYDLKKYHNLALPRIHFSAKNLKSITKACFPIFIFSALSIYLTNCQKYVLTYYAPNDIQTIFGILIMPATMLSLVGSYLIVPFIKNFAEYHFNHNYKQFAKSTLSILLTLAIIGIIVLTACYFFGVPILNFLYAINLNEYKTPLLIIILASIFIALSTILSGLLTVLEKNSLQTTLYAISAIIGTVASVTLINTPSPVQGAAIAFLISAVVLFTLFISSFAIHLRTLGVKHTK